MINATFSFRNEIIVLKNNLRFAIESSNRLVQFKYLTEGNNNGPLFVTAMLCSRDCTRCPIDEYY